MTIPFSPVQLECFRREAKKLSRELAITHSAALDRIASRYGLKNWSLLVKQSAAAPAIAGTTARSSHITSQRYYLHGDLVEGKPTQCYCARCDVFFDIGHFYPTSQHNDGKDNERFLSSLAKWNALSSSQRGVRYRPDNAPNVVQQMAEAQHAIRGAFRSPFVKWLEGQRHRNDPVGDLATDLLRDVHFPLGASSFRELEKYLSRHGDHVTRALLQAWREYQAPPTNAFAQALAEELRITVPEALELVDVEPEELTGQSGDMTYGYRFDFTNHASPTLRAKLLTSRGSLMLEVGPWFFDAIANRPG